MAENVRSKAGNPVLVSIAAFVVIVAGMRAAQPIIVPFLVAAFLALISLPPLHWFQKKGMPTWMALLAIIAIILLVGLAIAGVIGTSVEKLQTQLPSYQRRITVLQKELSDWLHARNIDVGTQFSPESFDSDRLMFLFTSLLSACGTVLNNALIILFMLVFMQLEAADLPAKLQAIQPDRSDLAERLTRIQDSVWQYVRLKTRISFLTGVLVAAWLWLLGVDFALLWGLLAFLFNFVPNIGSIIAALPAVLVALLQPGAEGQPGSVIASIFLATYVALGYLVINLVIGNVVEPRMMGRGVGLSTLVVFLSLIFWGWVLGPVGMILSVPLTMIVKIVLDHSEDLKWVSILLGSEVRSEAK